MRWSTYVIEQLCQKYTTSSARVRVTAEPPGGDYDTTNVRIAFPGSDDGITIVGFVDFGSVDDLEMQDNELDDCERINVIELRTLQTDSRGGIQTRDKTVRDVAFAIRDELEDLGFRVVDHYDQIS